MYRFLLNMQNFAEGDQGGTQGSGTQTNQATTNGNGGEGNGSAHLVVVQNPFAKLFLVKLHRTIKYFA